MNILVTGSNGQLGRSLRKASVGSGHHFVFTDITEAADVETLCLDVCDEESVQIFVESEKIDVIVNCAAYTGVDMAEDDIYMANLVNCEAPALLSSVAKRNGILLVHISTDYVFSGKNHPYPYTEKDIPDPESVYGVTKLAGEDAIMKSGCKYVVLRTSWMYSLHGKNFVNTMLSLFSRKDEVRVVFDSAGTPTCAEDVADAIMHIIDDERLFEKTGLYHFSSEGVASWYDFAQAIRVFSGSSCRVIPVRSTEYPARARRPVYSVLDKTLFKNTFGVEIPHWTETLRKTLQAYNESD